MSTPTVLTALPDRHALAARGALQTMASGRASAVDLTARALAAAEDCRRDLNAFSGAAHEAAMARAREKRSPLPGELPAVAGGAAAKLSGGT